MGTQDAGRFVLKFGHDGRMEIQLPLDCDLSDLTALRPIVEAVREFRLRGATTPENP